jgi:mono/diheme cytochrome c family protein
MSNNYIKSFVCVLLWVLPELGTTAAGAEAVRFGRDVLPILSTNCYACHGPDSSVRKADLRLDLEADAKAPHAEGTPVVAGSPAESTLIQRIISSDPEVMMPPPDSHRILTPEQVEILQRWVSEGAVWGRHWSFETIERPHISVNRSESPIDILVSRELAGKGLTLRPSATAQQLMRRASLDLVGLPPSLNAADEFAAAYESAPNDAAKDAVYELMIDDLLASPRFGEHWARLWMDLARYADTKGYEKDLGRTMWPWRDWLVNAINADTPLDQMTVEQLAGDLLPEPTTSQLIATAFHRNTMSNDEGGTDDEEFRTIAVKDRVDTTMQVWMGLTAGCAKCHSHKYDPISQQEYYSLYAIFNQTQDADRYDDSPTLEILKPSNEADRNRLNEKIASLETQLQDAEATAAKLDENRWQFSVVENAVSDGGATLTTRSDAAIVVSGTSASEDVYQITLKLKAGRHTVLRIEALPEKFADGKIGVGRNPRDPNFVLSELEVELLAKPESKRLTLISPRADFSQENWPVSAALDGDTKTGWAVSPRQRERHVALFALAEPLQLEQETPLKLTLRQHYGDSLTLRCFRISLTGEDPARVELPQPTSDQRRLIDEIATVKAELQELMNNVAKVPVIRAVATENQRKTQIHRRGNFLDPADEVTAGLPMAFHGQPEKSTSIDRLVLAQWLMSRENTLTPRVWANRIWARLFGIGIVETEEDFGTLGATPSHPVLLDWLAAEYRDEGWSLKRFLKTILMSRTWRQTASVTTELREADPQNRLFSRGARFRLSAETVRDQALAVSGLLSDKMGGPPVMPPQPEGLWRSTYNGQKWINAEGDDRFRRALYTYLKRTTPYPSMTTFDGGSGEVCQIRRIRTNTPLQALVTLNDPVYLETAGALAKGMTALKGSTADRTAYGLRLALIRPLREGETRPLERLQQDAHQSLDADPEKAKSLIQSTRTSTPEGMSDAEFASWIVVANTILNLDEFLTRN